VRRVEDVQVDADVGAVGPVGRRREGVVDDHGDPALVYLADRERTDRGVPEPRFLAAVQVSESHERGVLGRETRRVRPVGIRELTGAERRRERHPVDGAGGRGRRVVEVAVGVGVAVGVAVYVAVGVAVAVGVDVDVGVGVDVAVAVDVGVGVGVLSCASAGIANGARAPAMSAKRTTATASPRFMPASPARATVPTRRSP
jgi:hypothetical protein